MDTSGNSPSATVTKIQGYLSTTLTSADSTVTQSVHALTLVHQARLSQLTRTAATLKAQYGANDPAVKSAEASVSAAATTVARVKTLHQQLTAPAPQVATNGWALQGRVLNSDLTPAARFTVFLVDANKSFLHQYGFTYTDDTGYFLINFAGADTQSQAPPQLFIEIANQSAKPVYLDSNQFQPVIGSSSYRNIVLSADGQPIGDPPDEIRREALPEQKGS